MDIQYFLYILLISVAIIYGIAFYKRLRHSFRLLTQFLVITLVSEISGRLISVHIGYNYPVYHIHLFFSILYYSLIYLSLLPKKNIYFSIVGLAGLINITGVLWYIIKIKSLFFFPSVGLICISLTVTTMALVLFFTMMRSPKLKPILRQSEFWFNAGTLIFYAITFFVFAFFKYFQDQGEYIPEWGFKLIEITNFILYGCYFLSLYLERGNSDLR